MNGWCFLHGTTEDEKEGTSVKVCQGKDEISCCVRITQRSVGVNSLPGFAANAANWVFHKHTKLAIVTLSTSFVNCASISEFLSDPMFCVLFYIPEGYTPLDSCLPYSSSLQSVLSFH